MTTLDAEPTCVACGRTNPPKGCKLTEDYEWVCRDIVACTSEIARQIREGTRK